MLGIKKNHICEASLVYFQNVCCYIPFDYRKYKHSDRNKRKQDFTITILLSY